MTLVQISLILLFVAVTINFLITASMVAFLLWYLPQIRTWLRCMDREAENQIKFEMNQTDFHGRIETIDTIGAKDVN